MSESKRWGELIEGVAGLNLGGRGKKDTRSRNRNMALIAAAGQFWRSSEIDQIKKSISSENIENNFELANSHRELIRAKKSNQQAMDYKNQAPSNVDFKQVKNVEKYFGSEAWDNSLFSNEQLRRIRESNPDDSKFHSYANYNAFVKKSTEGFDNAASKQMRQAQEVINRAYQSNLRKIQQTILQGKAENYEEIQPFINQAKQMRVDFNFDNSSLLDILTGKVRDNIRDQTTNIDQFKAEFITNPQLKARESINKLKNVNPDNTEEMNLAVQNLPTSLRDSVPYPIWNVLNNLPSETRKQMYGLISEGFESNPTMTQADASIFVNGIVAGVSKATLNETQLSFASLKPQLPKLFNIEEKIENKDGELVTNPNYKAIERELDRLAITSTPTEFNSNIEDIRQNRTQKLKFKEALKTATSNIETIPNGIAKNKATSQLKAFTESANESVISTDFATRNNQLAVLNMDILGQGFDDMQSTLTTVFEFAKDSGAKTFEDLENFITSSKLNNEEKSEYRKSMVWGLKNAPGQWKQNGIFPGDPDKKVVTGPEALQTFKTEVLTQYPSEGYTRTFDNVTDRDAERIKQADYAIGNFYQILTGLEQQQSYHNGALLDAKTNVNKDDINIFALHYISKNMKYDENSEQVMLPSKSSSIKNAFKAWQKTNTKTKPSGMFIQQETKVDGEVLINIFYKPEIAELFEPVVNNPVKLVETYNKQFAGNSKESNVESKVLKNYLTQNTDLNYDDVFEMNSEGILSVTQSYLDSSDDSSDSMGFLKKIFTSTSTPLRSRTNLDDEYDDALRQLKAAAKYPRKFPKMYDNAVAKEQRLRNTTGTRYEIPEEYLNLKEKISLLSKGSDTTRGLRNQNVFNIRDFDQDFNGETGVDKDDFLQFENVELGIRAADRILTTYGKKHKLDTVEAVIKRFAPKADNNDIATYIPFVAKESGFEAQEKIDLSDPQVRARLLAPMASIESKYKTTPEKILTMLENI